MTLVSGKSKTLLYLRSLLVEELNDVYKRKICTWVSGCNNKKLGVNSTYTCIGVLISSQCSTQLIDASARKNTTYLNLVVDDVKYFACSLLVKKHKLNIYSYRPFCKCRLIVLGPDRVLADLKMYMDLYTQCLRGKIVLKKVFFWAIFILNFYPYKFKFKNLSSNYHPQKQ